MRFLLLGNFEIRLDDGSPLAVSRVKHRQLLVRLLLDSPWVATVDRCVATLWDERQPASARRNLQTYVAALRSTLNPYGLGIETAPGGYRIMVTPQDLDLAEFETLRARGTLALRSGDDEAAADLLHRALGLWRGKALNDLIDGSETLRNAATQLNDRRLTAIRDYVQACVRIHAYGEAVDQLRLAIAGEPLREDLWAELMLVLHKSGRRADALFAFRDCRVALIDQVGLEPAQRLVALHERILLDDPAL